MYKKFFLKNYFAIFILFFLLFGSSILKNYGYAWDNGIHRLIGFINLKYISKTFSLYPVIEKKVPRVKNIPDIEDHPRHKFYGSILTLPSAVIEIVSGLTKNEPDKKNNEKIYYLSCFLSFSIYCLALFFFNKTLIFLTKNKILSFLGTIFLILTPRIFAESFYNITDIFLLSLVIITNYFFLKYLSKPKKKNLYLTCLFCSFCIITRVSTGIIAVVFLLVYLLKYINKEIDIKNLLITNFRFFLFICLFYYIFFPYLWKDPFNFFVLINEMSNFTWNGKILYFGETYFGKEAPGLYQIVMFFFTTPLAYTIIFSIFFSLWTYFVLKKKIKLNYFTFFIIFCFFSIFLISIFFQQTKYNGWRHIYFVYVYFVTLTFITISEVSKLESFIKFKKFIYFVLILILFQNLYWISKNHPNQYAYFNNLMNNYHKNFDIDWWGISNKEAIKFIDLIDKRNQIYIFSNGPSLRNTTARLLNGDESKFKITKKENDANYIIDNSFRLNSKKNYKKFYPIVYQIKTDNTIISTIYKVK